MYPKYIIKSFQEFRICIISTIKYNDVFIPAETSIISAQVFPCSGRPLFSFGSYMLSDIWWMQGEGIYNWPKGHRTQRIKDNPTAYITRWIKNRSAKVSEISWVTTQYVLFNLMSLIAKIFNLLHLKYPFSAGNLISFGYTLLILI